MGLITLNEKVNDHKTYAVIHMGVHKTGTTSIQDDSEDLQKELQADGYDTPWSLLDSTDESKEDRVKRFSQIEFSACFRHTMNCKPELLEAGLEVASKQRNLLVSAETFSRAGTPNMVELKDYLSSWSDVVVVVYYRHFFSWIGSLYNQQTKNSLRADYINNEYRSLDEFVETAMKSSTGINKGFSANTVKRAKEVFDNVVVMNMHDKSMGDATESFYCHAIPNANHTCAALREKESNTGSTKDNGSEDLDYMHLIQGAAQSGLIKIRRENIDETSALLDAVKRKIDKFYKKGKELKRNCLQQSTLDMMWNLSLEYKRTLFPVSHDPSLDEDNMKLEFEKASKTTLCTVDVEETLSQETWQNFFKSL